MPNTTTNYNLTKPLETERYDVQVFNNNADIIDAQMKSNADGIANVNSRLDNLNNWTTVEFTLADFMYDENSGITYLRTEAPSGYEIAEIKGYMVLNKREVDSSNTNMVIDMTNPNYLSEMNGTAFQNTLNNTIKGFAAIFTTNINLDLRYTQNITTYTANSVDRNWATSPILSSVSTRGKSIAAGTKYTATSFTLKTDVPYTNISEFYGKLQYRVVPSA